MKLRTDLRNLLADQHTVEEEMEAAAVAAAAMMQWLAPISSPWRLHQREMMRKIENLHRQMLRKAGGAAAIARAALTNGSTGPNFGTPFHGHPSYNGFQDGRFGSYQRNTQSRFNGGVSDISNDAPSRLIIREVDSTGDLNEDTHLTEDTTTEEVFLFESTNEGEQLENLPEQILQQATITEIVGKETEAVGDHVAGASGDHLHESGSLTSGLGNLEDKSLYNDYSSADLNSITHSNASKSAAFSRGDGFWVGSSRSGHNNKYRGEFSRQFDERPSRGFRNSYANRGRGFVPGNHSTKSFSFSQSIKNIAGNNPSNNTFDMNCGFTDEEVEELFCQGIKPWDSEASAALAVLHGEMDHLLN